MLRRLHRLLLAVIALVVCLVVTGPGRGIVGVRASIAMAHEGARQSTPSRGAAVDARDVNDAQGSVDVERTDGDGLEAIETERGDEEDDAVGDVAEESAFAPPGAEFCGSLGRHGVAIIRDTSRASSGTTRARGPPA